MQLTGNTVTVAVTLNGQDVQAIDQIDVKGNARFRELPSADTKTDPLAIDARAFRLNNPDSQNAFVQAIGEPTVITTGGFKFTAKNIQLDRQKNLVWSNGKGEATIPIDQDFNGEPLRESTEAIITWDRSMEFDGSLIKLSGHAFVDGPEFQMRARHLQALLDRHIDFSQKSIDEPNIKQITAQDDVRAIYETHELGRLMSSTFFQVPNITVNALNGDMSVDGAGQIMLTKRGFNERDAFGDQLDGQQERGTRQRVPKVANEEKDDLLTFLQIDFQSDVRGNAKKRNFTFNRHVKTIYGPVYDWDQKINPNADPQENDILMSCDSLVVAQGPAGQDRSRPIDLRANGNAFVEGQSFQAAGERITYDQSKDMLVLRGTSNREAEIRYRDVTGTTIENSAKEFKFFPSQRRAEFNEVPVLEFRTIGK